MTRLADFTRAYPPFDDKAVRVCLVTSAVAGPTLNGGIATAFYSLAKHMALSNSDGATNFKVTVLYAAHPYYSNNDKPEYWIKQFANEGIDFVPLPESPLSFYGSKFVTRAYRIFEWLRERESSFDVISYHDNMANGYYVALAKHQKLFFTNVFLFVQCHSTVRWADNLNYRPPKDHHTLGYYYMEQKSIEWADARVSPSQYYFDWMQDDGRYNLSHGFSFVLQNTLYPLRPDVQDISLHKTTHFVFFARLEARKGLIVFCDALDIIAKARTIVPQIITFIGPDVSLDGQLASAIIRSRQQAEQWPFKVIIEHEFNTEQSLKYIDDHDAITVLPTLGDNSPYALMEIIAYGLPMITTDAGGGKELFIDDPESSIIVPANDAAALSEKMIQAMTKGIRNVAMSSSFTKTRDDYFALIKSFSAYKTQHTKGSVNFKPFQKITMGIPTHNRPDELVACVQSLTLQNYPTDLMHVIIYDDASTDPLVEVALSKSQAMLQERGMSHQIIRGKTNSFVAMTRNKMLEIAVERGDDYMCLLVRCFKSPLNIMPI